MVKEAKRDYFINEIGNDHEPAKFWSRLHSMFPDKPTTGKINLLEMLDESEWPDYANTFFSFTSIGTNITQDTGFDVNNWS